MNTGGLVSFVRIRADLLGIRVHLWLNKSH